MNLSDSEDISLELDDFGVLLVTLNRPEKLNALTPPIRRHLKLLPDLARNDDRIKVVVITGAGRGFCSGADMSAGAPNPYPIAETRSGLEQTRYGWVASLRSVAKPILAAINGPAVGGGLSLALACDVRFAAESATLGAAWVRRGLVPDMGASKLLTELLGPGRALRFIWAGQPISAQQAFAMGLVDEVLPESDLLSTVMAHASSSRNRPVRRHRPAAVAHAVTHPSKTSLDGGAVPGFPPAARRCEREEGRPPLPGEAPAQVHLATDLARACGHHDAPEIANVGFQQRVHGWPNLLVECWFDAWKGTTREFR